jgi:hypothetical protein|tara:strand:+ start:1113 stop:1430 length:318 start_codon:yes stop_codon:yes gene_type:complete
MSKREGEISGGKSFVKEKTKLKHTSKHISSLKQNLQKNVQTKTSNEIPYMNQLKKNTASHLARLHKSSLREAIQNNEISIDEANNLVLESLRDDSELIQETAHGE